MAMSSHPKSIAIMSMLRAEYPNYHPLLSIARLAHAEGQDPRLVFDCHKVIAKYVEPELKSIEVTPPADTRARVSVSLFQDEEVQDVTIKEPVPGEQAALVALEQW